MPLAAAFDLGELSQDGILGFHEALHGFLLSLEPYAGLP
jgi:hypothetical protein